MRDSGSQVYLLRVQFCFILFQQFFLLFFPSVNNNINRKSYSFACLIFIPLSLQTNISQ